MKTPDVLVPLADGFEEIEAVTVVDILRRAGARVITAGLDNPLVTGSNGIPVYADELLEACLEEEWDMIVLPGGGGGTDRLLADERLAVLLRAHAAAGRDTAAICAAPRVLDAAGLADGRTITVHPSQAHHIRRSAVENIPVADGGRIITGRSAGAAMPFAFSLVRRLFDEETARRVNEGVMAELKR